MTRRYSVNLIAAIRDPMGRDFEAEQMEKNGRVCIYRFLADKAVFFRATLPSGAAAPVFRSLTGEDKVPVSGWVALGEKPRQRMRLLRH
jgi:hypothetical protein